MWDDINWDDALHAYVMQRGDLCGLIDAQGRLVLDARYAALAPVDTESDPAGLWISGKMRIRVLTDDDRRGVVDGQGDVVVPLVYTDLADIIWLPAPDPAGITPPPQARSAAMYACCGAWITANGTSGSKAFTTRPSGARHCPARSKCCSA